jgi:hypothetical protein
MQCGFVNTPAESIGHMLGKVCDMPILRFHSGIDADRLRRYRMSVPTGRSR